MPANLKGESLLNSHEFGILTEEKMVVEEALGYLDDLEMKIKDHPEEELTSMNYKAFQGEETIVRQTFA